ncbi:PAAR domain-containing protein [Sorangium sp. So ce513]|uniref:PAAR domain-containing protein n=1 Tax=Sorangium sp. So ce513 TaxID=3133315 RepID=UPI003F5DA7C0
MTALEAARLGDSIAHSSAWSGLLTGAVVGVAMAATVVAVVGTGGVAAVFIGAGIAAAGAGGGLAGAYIGELIPGDIKGTVATGSPDTFFGKERRSAVRAGLDIVACADHGVVRVAQGSATTFVNGKPLARSSEKMECGAILREGIATVIIGGDTALAPGMAVADEVPPWAKTTLTVVMWGGAIVATGGAAAAVGWGAALAGFGGSVAGGAGLGWAGGKVGRHYGGELGARIGEVIGGTVGGIAGGLVGARIGELVLRGGGRSVETTRTAPAKKSEPARPADAGEQPTAAEYAEAATPDVLASPATSATKPSGRNSTEPKGDGKVSSAGRTADHDPAARVEPTKAQPPREASSDPVAARRAELSVERGKITSKTRAEADSILQAEQEGLVSGTARRTDARLGEPDHDFVLEGETTGKKVYVDIKTPVDPKYRPLSQQASDIAGHVKGYGTDVEVIVDLKNLTPSQKEQFLADLQGTGAGPPRTKILNR